jgi:xanthine/uracil/vitamin C permease (AzgA family)
VLYLTKAHCTCRAWRDNSTESYLKASTDAVAATYFLDKMNLTLPINPVAECSQRIFAFGPSTPFPMVQLGLPNRSPNYSCMGKQLQSMTMWLGIFGGALMVILMVQGVKASILIGILFVTFISWMPDHAATYFEGSSKAGGEARYEYFLKGAALPSVALTGGKLDFPALSKGDVWVALITFLYLDFMDATSTMFSLARMISAKVPGFLDHKGSWPHQLKTMIVDGVGIIIGATLGTSPLTVLAESAVGVREGGHTGITAIIVAIGFGLSMFLAPIFASIPPYATGPAIIFVGALMMEHSRHVQWEDVKVAVPCFLTIILMPLTYSIAYGVMGGLLSAILLWIVCFALDLMGALILKSRPMRQVWLQHMSNWYVAFNMEQVLIDGLPGYVPSSVLDSPSVKGSDSSSNGYPVKPEVEKQLEVDVRAVVQP